MSMQNPQTMFELIDWCLRSLGGDNMFAPPIGGLISIDITKQQLIDRASEAVYRFNREHYNGYRQVGLILPLNKDQNTYTLPDNIINVIHYLNLDDKSTMFSFDYQMRQSMGFNYGKMGGFDIVSVELTYQWLKLVDQKLGKKLNFTFNPLTHNLELLTPLVNYDGSVGLVCYMLEDVMEYPDVWQDEWLKSYLFNLIKKQWGQNLKKFTNVTLPGSAQLNGEQIYDEAVTAIEKLLEELETKYSYPPMFFMG